MGGLSPVDGVLLPEKHMRRDGATRFSGLVQSSGGLTGSRVFWVFWPSRGPRDFRSPFLLGPLEDLLPHRLHLAFWRLLETVEKILRHTDVPVSDPNCTHFAQGKEKNS